jgi:NADH:ubiquinone oxidoreductase subunit 3 (subunit A)/NADH:ubiquinone oxidoreductase subunit 6 (subunit J)
MELFLPIGVLKMVLPLLAVTAGVFVITTKNAIISVFNLIVLYILVAFYLIYIGITYLGISYIVVYIGAIAILFLFVIMMIDIEVVEKRSNNYLPLLFFLLGGFFFTLKNIFYNIGVIKMKSFSIDIIKKIEPVKKEDLFVWERIPEINSRVELEELNKTMDYVRELTNAESTRTVSNSWIFEMESIKEKENGEKQEEESFSNISESSSLDEDNLELEEYNLDWSLFKNIPMNESIFNILKNVIGEKEKDTEYVLWDLDVKFNNDLLYNYQEELQNNNYLLVIPNWDLAANRVTQISAIGDVLYTVYHSYIYIISVLLLLGMIGAIILTADNPQEIRIIKKEVSGSQRQDLKVFESPIALNGFYNPWLIIEWIKYKIKSKLNLNFKIEKIKSNSLILPFFDISAYNNLHSEGIIGNLFYFIIVVLIIAALLLFINSYFSLSVKYLDKGGGFECGFTSFVQTRERFNVVFYRVSLLFLVFDLEIILIFPYTAIYQKYQNISKNNVLAFLYILIVGFIYELKEGALNIVKKAHNTEINNLD